MSTLPRYLYNDADGSRRDPKKQLRASLERLIKNHPPDKVPLGGGLYYGPLSVAFLLLKLSQHYPDYEIQKGSLSSWASAYLRRAQSCNEYPGPSATSCGIADDTMALVALEAITTSINDDAATSIQQRDSSICRLCGFVDAVTSDSASNEWLYGRAGYLYLLRMVRDSLPQISSPASSSNNSPLEVETEARTITIESQIRKSRKLLTDTSEKVTRAIIASSRPWTWHGKPYLGAAHGAIGIITQVVLSNPSWASELEDDLRDLLNAQFGDEEGGNFPTTLPLLPRSRDGKKRERGGGIAGKERRRRRRIREKEEEDSGGGGQREDNAEIVGEEDEDDDEEEDEADEEVHEAVRTGMMIPRHSERPQQEDRLVQFCHGAPGVVTSLLSMREDAPSSFASLSQDIDRAIRRGRECIRRRGLLTKEPCLCHGTSGNALVLEEQQEEGFQSYLAFTTAGEMKAMAQAELLEQSEHPESLWCGEAGRAWAWAVADKGLRRRFLGYNDI